MSDPSLVLGAAPTGARRGKRDHPALPITIPEIAEASAASVAAGASLLHLHVRDADGRHLLDAGAYREALAAVRAAIGTAPILQVTTEAAGRYTPAEQIAVATALAPEAVSIAPVELIPDSESRPAAARFLAWLAEARIGVQLILYSPDQLAWLDTLVAAGTVPSPVPPRLFVLGRYARNQAGDPAELAAFHAQPRSSAGPWMVCCFGAREAAAAERAARLGGDVRAGFETNLWLPDGSRARDNADVVRAAAGAARAAGRSLATPAEARTRMLPG